MQRSGGVGRRPTGGVAMSRRHRHLISLLVCVYRAQLLRECRFVAQLSRTSVVTPAVVRVACMRLLLRHEKLWK